MQYNGLVHGSQAIKPSFIEENGDSIYLRINIEQIEIADGSDVRKEWQYDETVLTRLEYQSILQGRLIGAEWTDALRTLERTRLYRDADDMISKYSTDAVNESKKQEWIDYKAAVRATQDAEGYPQTVVYPEQP